MIPLVDFQQYENGAGTLGKAALSFDPHLTQTKAAAVL